MTKSDVPCGSTSAPSTSDAHELEGYRHSRYEEADQAKWSRVSLFWHQRKVPSRFRASKMAYEYVPEVASDIDGRAEIDLLQCLSRDGSVICVLFIHLPAWLMIPFVTFHSGQLFAKRRACSVFGLMPITGGPVMCFGRHCGRGVEILSQKRLPTSPVYIYRR